MDKHILTEKHKKNCKDINNFEVKKVDTEHICNGCSKKYKHRQSLHNHKKSCEKLGNNNNIKNNTCSDATNINELKEEIASLKQLINNIGAQTNTNNDSSTNTNNNIDTQNNTQNNTHNDNRNITINCYTDTDDSHLKTADFEEILQSHVFTAMTKLLELRHINPDKPENMNLLITNMKDKYMKEFKNNGWKIVNRQQKIAEVFDDCSMILTGFNDKTKLSARGKSRYKLMDSHHDNQDKRIQDEMAYELYNSKDIILETKNKQIIT
jgi:hypothetical protein